MVTGGMPKKQTATSKPARTKRRRGVVRETDQSTTEAEAPTAAAQPQMLQKDAWLQNYPAAPQKNIRWFWVGVGSFLVLIVGIWTISIFVQISSLEGRRTTGTDLVTETKNSWDSAFSETAEVKNPGTVREALVAALQHVPQESTPIVATTTTATTTLPAVVTSTVADVTSTPTTTTLPKSKKIKK